MDSSGKTIQTVLTSGESDLTWDAGLKFVPKCLTFSFSGNTATDGTDGNIRSYTVDGVKVNVSAFAEDKSTHAWSKAYLGAYSSGLGVTDSSEGSGSGDTHTVDNIGRNNYVLFEFSQQVVIDKAYFGYVVNDSDAQIWIGTVTDPISSHLNLNSSVLSSLGLTELNQTTSSSARWADFNAGEVTGNVLVIAADTTDTTPEDRFKISKLAVCTTDVCDPVTPPPVEAACAKIVGATSINEGSKASYMVQLDKAVDEDVWFKIQTLDGSAHRVDQLASNQDIIWGGYYDYTDKDGRHVVNNKVPNGPYVSDGDHAAVGPKDASWDYTVSKGGVIQAGGEVMVLVKAGETASDAFTIDAWKEKVTVDLDAGNASGYNEGTETFQIKIVSDDSDKVDACAPLLDVSIGDRTSYVTYSPIALDLNGDGIHTTALGETAGKFDLLGNGSPIASGWLSAADAFLAHDANGNGMIDGVSELFGGARGEGFAKLASFDSNGDGVVDALDARFGELLVWQDANQNHSTDAGELRSLAEQGIASLKVGFEEKPLVDDNANVHLEHSSATLADGSSIDMVDVYFNAAPTSAEAAGSNLATLGNLIGSDLNLDALLGAGSSAATAPAQPLVAESANDAGYSEIAAMKHMADLYDQAVCA